MAVVVVQLGSAGVNDIGSVLCGGFRRATALAGAVVGAGATRADKKSVVDRWSRWCARAERVSTM